MALFLTWSPLFLILPYFVHNFRSTKFSLGQLSVTNFDSYTLLQANICLFPCRTGPGACKDLESVRGFGFPRNSNMSDDLAVQGPRKFFRDSSGVRGTRKFEACEVCKNLERVRSSGCPRTSKVPEDLLVQRPQNGPRTRRSEDLGSLRACEANCRQILRPAGCSTEARPARLPCGRSMQ